MEYLKRIGRYVKSKFDRPMISYPLTAYFYGLLIRYFIPPICAATAHLFYALNYPFGSPERGTFHYHTFYLGGLDRAIEEGYQYGVEHPEVALGVLAGFWGVLCELVSWLTRAKENELSISPVAPSSPSIELSGVVSASPPVVFQFPNNSIPISHSAVPASSSEPRKNHRRTQSNQY